MYTEKFNASSPENRRRLVRRVIVDECELADVIFDAAAGGRIDWDVSSWQELLDELDKSQQKVGDYLDQRARA